jgi:hypothetical protein
MSAIFLAFESGQLAYESKHTGGNPRGEILSRTALSAGEVLWRGVEIEAMRIPNTNPIRMPGKDAILAACVMSALVTNNVAMMIKRNID